ncbi:MAG: NADH-quinone oxidoreductase subunit J [Acidobacteriota bacterium]
MHMDALYFWILAAAAVIASLLVVGQRNPMHSVMWLIVSFCALSGLYVLLGAPFVAAIQIIIYAGAIMVLFLFVVMLLNVPTETPDERRSRLPVSAGPRHFGAVLSLALVVELAWALSRVQGAAMPANPTETSVHAIGLRLYRDYAFAFESTSVLILVAMVGAIILARKEQK